MILDRDDRGCQGGRGAHHRRLECVVQVDQVGLQPRAERSDAGGRSLRLPFAAPQARNSVQRDAWRGLLIGVDATDGEGHALTAGLPGGHRQQVNVRAPTG
jgi:hypothetical protein